MRTQTRTFYPKKSKIIFVLTICIAFVAAGIFLITLKEYTIGWLSIIFFGVGCVIMSIQLLPNSSYLKLTEQGLEMKSLFKTNVYKWDDIKDFENKVMSYNQMIFFNFEEHTEKFKYAKKLSKTLGMHDAVIQASYDNISPEELCNLMHEYKNRKAT